MSEHPQINVEEEKHQQDRSVTKTQILNQIYKNEEVKMPLPNDPTNDFENKEKVADSSAIFSYLKKYYTNLVPAQGQNAQNESQEQSILNKSKRKLTMQEKIALKKKKLKENLQQKPMDLSSFRNSRFSEKDMSHLTMVKVVEKSQ